MFRRAIRKIILLLFLFSIPLLGCGGGGDGGGGGAGAGTISLAWDANTEPDVAGYKIYYGTASRSYGASVDVGNVTTYVLGGLTPGQVYYISATAYNTSHDQSGYSNEVSGPAQ
jgi:hypothetical protein